LDFYNVVTDKSLLTKSLIEKAIRAQHIKQLPNTETYMIGEEIIATSTAELVGKLNNDAGKVLRSQIETMVKSLNTSTLIRN